ncbi:DUF881 domain-containing protein [Rhodococcoides kyotonense]|uniref:Uncharacterized conserved protein YlxW, UPF0749 family n=1 Tax=Rhodococcoides kyotonense TaxID=398843 RepID=A0A239JRP7_9NOCA|nr:DUF881 domain-containing protein [Rhodococcus kyotonensis]SNT08541.1 Uncharacterized conserved protein YlxW, UPF0749 family [Rhodococcus kyotonensis]
MTQQGRHEVHAPTRRRSVVFGCLAVLLMAILGIGLAAQVRVNDSEDYLDSARPADLLVVLDNLGRREAAIREDIATLQNTLSTLQNQNGGSGAALEEARAELDALSIQVGSVAATGPGVVVTITDPRTGVGSEVLVDAVQELRAAGAEALQIAGGNGETVRIGIDSWIAGSAGFIVVDGREMAAPFVLTAIGDAATLSAALDIPGGVVDTVARNGGECAVSQSEQVTVSALRDPRSRQYAQPGN